MQKKKFCGENAKDAKKNLKKKRIEFCCFFVANRPTIIQMQILKTNKQTNNNSNTIIINQSSNEWMNEWMNRRHKKPKCASETEQKNTIKNKKHKSAKKTKKNKLILNKIKSILKKYNFYLRNPQTSTGK